MKKLVPFVALATLAGALALGGFALAADGSARDEYVDRLEEVCKPRAELTARATEGVRGDIRAGRYKVAAGKFDRAGRIFKATVQVISVVPQPPEDMATLARWFGYLQKQESYLGQIAGQLRAGDPVGAQHLTAAFVHNGNRANHVTLAFGFNYCRFKFSRFG
ncbi:MAG TPA: hypothetical protein VHQ43_12400 [Solirubrobacterales bacterium]|jgi:hypothetical protein|nr:hypothetical protein [Solirubrobacterales bacterium]